MGAVIVTLTDIDSSVNLLVPIYSAVAGPFRPWPVAIRYFRGNDLQNKSIIYFHKPKLLHACVYNKIDFYFLPEPYA